MENAQEQRFKALFPNGTAYKPALVEYINTKNSENLELTSAFWKFFLVLFPGLDSNTISAKEWIPFIQNKRNEYLKILENKKQFENLKNESNDPLSRDNPIWKQHFEDLKLIEEIKRDTTRYFASTKPPQFIEDISVNIIFFYFRHFNFTRYYQEIHYIACETVLLCWKEMHCNLNKEDELDPYKVLFDERYIECDSFWIFSYATNVMYKYFDQDADKDHFITREFCVNLEDQIIANSKISDIKNIACKIKEQGAEAAYMTYWVRQLFYKQFPDNWDKVLTHVFAYFPSMDFISALCEAILHSIMKKYNKTKDQAELAANLWHGKQSETDLRLAIYIVKKDKPQKLIGYEIGDDLQDLINDIDNISTDSIIENLDKLSDAVTSIILLKEKVTLITPEEIDNQNEIDNQFEENEENEPQKPTLLPKASKVGTADFHLLVQEDEEEKPQHKFATLQPKKDINDLFD